MKKIKKFLSITLVMIGLLAISAQANAAKGTLYGNAVGTKFCCSSGTNDCSASDCLSSNDE